MKIELHELTVREVAAGYADKAEEGVVGYGGRLNIRPKYQREFVYDDKKRNAVIDTVRKEFPLNVMYWVKNEGGTFEVLDGQQRTISFCLIHDHWPIPHLPKPHLIHPHPAHPLHRRLHMRGQVGADLGVCPLP